MEKSYSSYWSYQSSKSGHNLAIVWPKPNRLIFCIKGRQFLPINCCVHECIPHRSLVVLIHDLFCSIISFTKCCFFFGAARAVLRDAKHSGAAPIMAFVKITQHFGGDSHVRGI